MARKFILFAFVFLIAFASGFVLAGNNFVGLGDLAVESSDYGVKIWHRFYEGSSNDFFLFFALNGWSWINAATGEAVYIGVGYEPYYSAGGELGPVTNNFYKDLQLNDHEGNHVSVREADVVQAQELCLYDVYNSEEVCIDSEDLRKIFEILNDEVQ